jgi:hypothetical protein
MKRFFTEHPQSVGETYGQHLAFALGVGGRMVVAGIACMVHGLVPAFFKTTGSRAIRDLVLRINPGNRAAARAGKATTPLFTAKEIESLTSASL